MSAYRLSLHIMKERLTAGRMMVIWPLLAMFILFSSWGLSDPKANLPSSIVIDSAYDVMFVSTAFIIFSATMGAVLISFDGISQRPHFREFWRLSYLNLSSDLCLQRHYF